MANNFRIELAEQITLTETQGKAVLFSKKTGDFFGLNETAAFFVQELSKSDFLTTVQVAAKAYSAPEAELSSDITAIVDELEKNKLCKRIPVA